MGIRGLWCWPGSWPATLSLPAATAQRNPLESHIRKKSRAKNESTSKSAKKKTLFYPSWSLCHPWILPTPQEVLFFNRPPLAPHFSLHTLTTFTRSVLLCSVSSFSLTCSLLYGLNQERCSPSIANWLRHLTFITWQLGVAMTEVLERGSESGLFLEELVMIWV